MPVDNRMVLLTSKDDNTAAEDATALIASAGANNILIGELALNSYNGNLYVGADPDNASATIGGKVPATSDILGMTLSTAATMQAVFILPISVPEAFLNVIVPVAGVIVTLSGIWFDLQFCVFPSSNYIPIKTPFLFF